LSQYFEFFHASAERLGVYPLRVQPSAKSYAA
jgi:hypothetical protein